MGGDIGYRQRRGDQSVLGEFLFMCVLHAEQGRERLTVSPSCKPRWR